MSNKDENPQTLVVFVATSKGESRIAWPVGSRAVFDKGEIVEHLPDDHPVEYWVCCRRDEPWTWRVMTNQHVGPCAICGDAIIYRVSEKSPTESAVKKICRRCAERLSMDKA